MEFSYLKTLGVPIFLYQRCQLKLSDLKTMQPSDFFREGLLYLLSLDARHGAKAELADRAGINRGNFSSMLKGVRPIPEGSRTALARYMMLSVRDIERLGMDVTEGTYESLHIKRVLERKTFIPEMLELPDLDIYSVNIDTLESHLVGHAWTLDERSIMAEFEKEPEYQARYIFKKKNTESLEALSSEDESRAEDSK